MNNQVTDFVCNEIIDEYDATRFSAVRCSAEDLAVLIRWKLPQMIVEQGNLSGTWGAITKAALLYINDADWNAVAEYVIDQTDPFDWPEADHVEYDECKPVFERPEYYVRGWNC